MVISVQGCAAMQSATDKMEEDMAGMAISEVIPFAFNFSIEPYLRASFEGAMIDAIRDGKEEMYALLDVDVVNMYLTSWYPLVPMADEDVNDDEDDFSNILATEVLNNQLGRLLRMDVLERLLAWKGNIVPKLCGTCFEYTWKGKLLITNNVPHYDYTFDTWCELIETWERAIN